MEILIAEDDNKLLNLLINILSTLGHTVLTAQDGQEAWHIYQSTIHMVITDWMTPRMDGLELCRNIRTASRDHYTYIIVITGKEQKNDLLEILKCGADDYIIKPFDPEELPARIKAGERFMKLEEAHKNLQQVLIESRNKLRIVVDSLPEEIVSIDADFRIVSVNISFVKRRGLDIRATVVSRNVTDEQRKADEIRSLNKQLQSAVFYQSFICFY